MKIKKIVISQRKRKTGKAKKEDIINAVKQDMIHIGISKSLWVDCLELPEEDFDAILAKAADDAEHVAKGDERGLKLALGFADIEDEDDDDDNEED